MVPKQVESQHWYLAMPESSTPRLMEMLPQMIDVLLVKIIWQGHTFQNLKTFTTHYFLTTRLDTRPSRRITLSLPV